MNEEKKTVPTEAEEPQVEKLPRAKRTALVRYMAILFAFAFLIVLLSLIAQQRSTTQTISELSEFKASAVARAEQLQEENRALEQSIKEQRAEAVRAQTGLAQENEETRRVYDALVRLLAGPGESGEQQTDADRTTVREGLEKLSQSAKEAFFAYEKENGLIKTEDT